VPVNDEIAARRVVISSLTLKCEVNDEIAARRGRHFVVDVRNDELAHAEARFRRCARRPPRGRVRNMHLGAGRRVELHRTHDRRAQHASRGRGSRRDASDARPGPCEGGAPCRRPRAAKPQRSLIEVPAHRRRRQAAGRSAGTGIRSRPCNEARKHDARHEQPCHPHQRSIGRSDGSCEGGPRARPPRRTRARSDWRRRGGRDAGPQPQRSNATPEQAARGLTADRSE
jgi:hypothetical protein